MSLTANVRFNEMMKNIVKRMIAVAAILLITAVGAIYLLSHGVPPQTVKTDVDKRMLSDALGIMPSAPKVLRFETGWTDSTFYYRFTMSDEEYERIVTNGWRSSPRLKHRYGPLWWRPPERDEGWVYFTRQHPQYGELVRNKESGLTYFMTFHE